MDRRDHHHLPIKAIHLDYGNSSHRLRLRDGNLHAVKKILVGRNRLSPLLNLHSHLLHQLDSSYPFQHCHAADKVSMYSSAPNLS